MATALLTSPTLTTTTSRQTSQGDDPLLRAQVSFDNDLTQPPVWTDIQAYARSIDYQRGRNFELDQFQAGTMTITLSTNDGRFSPEYSSGPYAGYLTPLRRTRLIAEWDGTTYPLWAGFVETWEPSRNANGKDLVTTMKASDAFKAARYGKINGAYVASLSGDRTEALISALGIVEVVKTSSGTIAVSAETYTNQDALSAAQSAAQAESGFLYCDEQGRVRFDDRLYRVRNENANRIIFGDGAGETPYVDAVYSYNDENLYTEVRITPEGGAEQVSTDADAVRKYGTRTYSQTLPIINGVGDPTPNEAWARGLADYLLANYKDPGVRLDELTCVPASSPSVWSAVLAAPLGGRLLVRERPGYLAAEGVATQTSPTLQTTATKVTGTAGMLERAVFIESINVSIRPTIGKWIVKYGLSDADQLSYWILGSSLYSILGRTTRLAVSS